MTGADPIFLVSHALRRDAHAWVARLTVGEPTTDDARALAAWRATSAAHEAAYQEAAALWRGLRPAAESLRTRSPDRPGGGVDRRMMLSGALAAGVAGVMVVRPPLDLWPSLGDLVADAHGDYSTAPGEQRSVQLSSQVTAVLNTRTRLAHDRANPTARAVLLSGEGIFTVGAVAFTVQADGGQCSSRNADFDIRLDDDRTAVTCLGGEVRVQRGGDQVVLAQGRRVAFVGRGLARPTPVDLAMTTAWRRGEVVFRGAPLGEVIAELNRYRRGRLLLANRALAQRQVNGVFRIDRPDDILAQLEQGYGAQLNRLPGGLVVVT
jgi:transmembrane sensor